MQKTIKTFFPASFKVTMTVFFLKHVQGFGCTLVGLAIDLKSIVRIAKSMNK